MKNLFKVIRWEYLTRIRSKWFIISTLMMPLLLIGFMFLPSFIMTKADTGIKIIGLIDATGDFSRQFENLLRERYELKDGQPKYQVIVLRNSIIAAELLDSLIIDAYVHIPDDVLETNQVRYYARYLGDYRTPGEIQAVVNSILFERRVARSGLDSRLVRELSREVDFRKIEIGRAGEQKERNEILTYLVPIIFVLMLYFAIVMSSQVLMRSVLEERSNRLIEILLSSVSPTELMTGKILGLGFMGLTQLAIYLAVGTLISQSRGLDIISTSHIGFFLLYFVLGYLFFAAIFASVGVIFNSEQDAQQAVSLISLISVLPLLMSSYVIANPESVLTTLLAHIPFLTPFFMILLIGINIPATWQLLSTAAILIVAAILAMWSAGKIFRTAILMYGKRPTLPEIVQWIRAG